MPMFKLIYAVLILIYAIVVMTLLLDVQPLGLPRAKKLLFFVSMPLIVLVSIFFMLYFMRNFAPLYPILIHLPIVLVFCAISQRGFIKVFFVLLTAIFLTYPPAFMDWLAGSFLGIVPIGVLVIDTISCILLVGLIHRYMRLGFGYVMRALGTREVLIFCMIPLGYNILNYSIGQYNPASTVTPLRVTLFLSALGVYFLLMDVFRRTEEMQKLQREKDVVSMQLEASKEHLEELKSTQQQAATYRHDMRHHLLLIGGYLAEDNKEKIKEYLFEVQANMDAITPQRFCKNETVNLILLSFANKAKKVGVSLMVDTELPDKLALPDTELCAVLSNGLENAITAAALVAKENRNVRISCKLNRDKLLIFIENAYMGKVLIEKDMPKTSKNGHGFGTRSMVAIAQKRNGYCSCEEKEGIFTLRVVLPLDK